MKYGLAADGAVLPDSADRAVRWAAAGHPVLMSIAQGALSEPVAAQRPDNPDRY
jgi:hypothetical protein